jgi:Rieske Fe-S protein
MRVPVSLPDFRQTRGDAAPLPRVRRRRSRFSGGNAPGGRLAGSLLRSLAIDMRMRDAGAPLPRFNRRSFLDAVLGVGFVSTAAAIAYPVARYLVPPATGEAATQSASAGRAAALKPNSGLIFKFGNRPGIVVRTADGGLRAFSAICTHLDCTVQFRPDISQLWCACHNGYYDLGGNVVSGPPPRALEQFVVNLRGEPGEEELVVTRT